MSEKTFSILAAASGLALTLITAATAEAFPYRAGETHCHETIELLVAREFANGDKIEDETWLGAYGELVVRWDNGTVQELTVGPSGNQFCVLAARFVSSQATQ